MYKMFLPFYYAARLHIHQLKNFLTPLKEKNTILFVEIYRKNSVFGMNLSISNELQLFSKELQQHVSPHALDQLARKVGFVQ